MFGTNFAFSFPPSVKFVEGRMDPSLPIVASGATLPSVPRRSGRIGIPAFIGIGEPMGIEDAETDREGPGEELEGPGDARFPGRALPGLLDASEILLLSGCAGAARG